MNGLLWQAGEMRLEWYLRLGCVGESCSFAPLGLVCFTLSPRLALWAAFLRRFAAKTGPHRVAEILALGHTPQGLKPGFILGGLRYA
jgi:hypothetical protein